MADRQDQDTVPMRRIKLTTFGAFTISAWEAGRWVTVTHRELTARGSNTTFLKILASHGPFMDSYRRSLHPGEWERHEASRDVLIDALWPEEDQVPADPDNALSQAKSLLNRALRPAAGDDVVLLTDGSDKVGYALNQQVVFIDADDFERTVLLASETEGRGDRQQALTLWEQAYRLVQGDFLPHDQYNDWATARRERLHGKYHLCLHRLATLYLEQGRVTEVVEKLHPHVLAHPTDVDALCIMLPLLAQQGRYEEALQLAATCQHTLQDEGQEPSAAITSIERRLHKEQEAALMQLSQSTFDASMLPSNQYLTTDTRVSCINAQETKVELDLFSIGITALILHQQQHQWDVNELEQRVIQALDGAIPDMQNSQRTSRRNVLSFIAGMPLALYGYTKISDQSSSSLVLEEVIPLYAAGLPACWRLYYEGGQPELEDVLPGYLSHLTRLTQTPSKLQKSAAGLLSQTHQLMALMAQSHENFGRAIEHCKQAAFYGQQAADINLQAMALIRLQDTYVENKRFTQLFLTLKHAESFAEQITPLLRGRIYARISFAYAHQAQSDLALRYLDLAQETFPSHPENDASFHYNHTTHYVLYACQALAYVQLGQPLKAWETITKADEFVLGPTNPRRMDLTRHQTWVAIAMNDLERSCSLFETLASLTKQFGQELDVGNTLDTYQQLSRHWPREKQVQRLEEYLHL